ncbi:MAG: flagellar hook-length control protein FliK [Planctomycetota bacterium]|nr:flagellar hook-length control protein FliK [Planctomycetota bacterium]
MVAEGGPSGTGRLAPTSPQRSEAGERFDAKLSSRLREREAAGERVEDRRETLSATRERREARSERSERRNRSTETTESSSSTQATDEARERAPAQGEVEEAAKARDTQADEGSQACNEPTAERATDAARTEAKPAKAARGETPAGAPQVEGEQAPATETLGVQLGQGKGLESHAKLAPKPNLALEGANEAVEAPQGELAVEGEAPASTDVAQEVAQPAQGEAHELQPKELAAGAEKLEAAARNDATSTHAATREVAPRETTAATRPEVEAAKSAPRNEPPVTPERAADMLRQIRLQLSPELRQATIQLEPRELGRISVKVTMRGGSAHAELRVEKRSALDALQKQMPELEAALERAGLGGGELSLQLGLEEREGRHEAPESAPTRRSLQFNAPASLARALSARLPATSGIDTYA